METPQTTIIKVSDDDDKMAESLQDLFREEIPQDGAVVLVELGEDH